VEAETALQAKGGPVRVRQDGEPALVVDGVDGLLVVGKRLD
jgi:hypothetical protein